MLSEALRLIRVFHDLNQSDLAEQIEISRSYLSEIEGGKKEPSLELIKKYSVRFNIPVSSIMFFAENLSLIHISSPRDRQKSRMPSSA